MKPVVGGVERDEVRGAALVDDQAIDPEHKVDDAAAEQVRACAGGGAGQGEADDAEQQMDDVVQDGDLEQTEEVSPRNGGPRTSTCRSWSCCRG